VEHLYDPVGMEQKLNIKCSYTDLVDLVNLVPHPKNSNKHPDKQIDVLAKIIKARGMRHPIIISKRSGFITAGHGRLMALKKLGVEQAPVDYQDFENEADEIFFLEADNHIAEFADHDKSMMLDNLKDLDIDLDDFDFEELGLIDFELPEVEVLPPSEQDDVVPELKADPISKRGDVWLLGNHRVMNGDSTMIDDVEDLMDGHKADMVFTDPPYGISVVKNGSIGTGGQYAKGGDYRPIIGDDERFDVSFIREYFDCDLFLWGANYYCHDLEESNNWVVWQKIESSLTFSDGELAWTTLKTPLRIYKHIWAGSMRSGTHKDELKKRVHPTQKPVTLFCEIFKDLMEEKKAIVDLYLGSGSTLIACEKTNRKCYGMELSEAYCDVIIKRFQDFTGKEAILESTGETYNSLIKE